ncbi:MAG TPA: helix-turn-helix domain-containing protein [Ramlibacter sp.]|nr:helix-turn-helix domain-containing protein [Ramlibacter sp.]
MANIGTVLKSEIARIARKEVRGETQPLKKHGAQYRSDIAALKKRLADVERQLKRQLKSGAAESVPDEGETERRVRFSAKGLAARRQRLGLSARELGALLGVSAQSVYHWEQGKSRPRASQLQAIAALRSLGKRQAVQRLSSL